MNKIVKDALILFAITLVAGVLLGFVYDITKDPIAAQNEKAKQEAYKAAMLIQKPILQQHLQLPYRQMLKITQ